MVASPCKNCTKRVLHCHSTCEEYLVYKDKKKEENTARGIYDNNRNIAKESINRSKHK